MATRTSTQSGNFSSTSTWGGNPVPLDGDAFIISQGHTVTVNNDKRSTNGYADSYVYGQLKMANNGKLRMNGVLYIRNGSTTPTQHFVEGTAASGPYFHMEAGSRLEIKGNDAENHHLRIENAKYLTVECEGTDPRAKTTFSSAASLGSTSLPFTSATNFKTGDWIAGYVELENVDDWEIQGNKRDESWIVHDISGNTVYFRQFVSPTSEITKASGSVITVEDAAVFRKGYEIIFGTGSNRNVRTINSINYTTNKITLSSSVSGSVVGEIVYVTGTEKWHGSGDSVQQIATPLTADSNSGTNTITVANTYGLAAGDRILIEANNDADTNWDYEMLYTISSISGNTITLTANLGNTRKTGAWVTPFDRDTQITAATIEADGNATTSEDRPFIYMIHWSSTDAYYRRVRFRNVLFEGIGANDNSTWHRGISINRCSYENNSYGAYRSGFEGCVWVPNNSGNNATVFWRERHQNSMRRNVFYNGAYNVWTWSSGNNFGLFHNISWRSHYSCALLEGNYEPDTEYAYNHFSRSDDYGVLLYHWRDGAAMFRHNYMTHHENRPFYIYYQGHNVVFDKCYIDYYRYWPYVGRGGGQLNWLNCYFGNSWDKTTGGSVVNGVYVNSDSGNRPDRQNGESVKSVSLHHNFRINDTAEWSGHWWKIWDDDESAWRFRRDLSSHNWGGDGEAVLVPAGSTVYIAGTIKATVSNHSGNRPYLIASSTQGYRNGAYYNGTSSAVQTSENVTYGYPYGHYEATQFTSTSDTAYERRTITVSPVDYDYFLNVSIITNNTNYGNGDEGWYQKPLEIYLDKPSNVKSKKHLSGIQSKSGQNTSANKKKRRIGGRIR